MTECRMCGGEVECQGDLLTGSGDKAKVYGCSKCGLLYFKPPPSAERGGYDVQSVEYRVDRLEQRFEFSNE